MAKKVENIMNFLLKIPNLFFKTSTPQLNKVSVKLLENTVIKSAPWQTPERQTPERQTPERQTPERQTPERQTPDETNSWK